MDWPAEGVMNTLSHLCRGVEFCLLDDRDMVVVTPTGPMLVGGDDLDELDRRGWVALSDERVDVTEAGRYWSRRYEAFSRSRDRSRR